MRYVTALSSQLPAMWFSLIRGDTLRLMPSYCICVSLLLSLCFLYIAFSSFHSFLPPSPPLSCNQFFCRSLMCNACRQFSPASSIVSLQTRACLVLHAAHCVPCPTVKGSNSSCTFSHILKSSCQITPVLIPLDRLHWDGKGNVNYYF